MTLSNFFFLTGCVSLLCVSGCGEGTPAFQFSAEKQTVINEESLVIRHHPVKISFTGDSTAVMFTSRNLAEYNIYSGKMLRKFDGLSVNWDSVVMNSFAKYGVKGRTYLPCHGKFSDADLSSVSGSHISSFHFDGNQYWVFFSALCSYTFTDTATQHKALQAYASGNSASQMEKLLAEDPNLKSSISELKTFVLRLDKNFALLSVTPLYDEKMPQGENGQYLVMPSKGFYAHDNKLIVFATDAGVPPSDTNYFHDTDRVSFLAELDYSPDTIRFSKLLVGNFAKNMPVHLLSYSAYYDYGLRFTEYSGDVLAGFGMGFWKTSDGVASAIQPAEDLKTENVYEFAVGDHDLSYLHVPKDSARSIRRVCKLKIIDKQTKKVLADEGTGPCAAFARRGNKMLFVKKEKEKYVFNIYQLSYKP